MKNIDVFISSPSDLTVEREACWALIEREINAMVREKFQINLHCYLSEKEGGGVGNPMVRHGKLAAECDIYIGMMWQRFGSPTGTFDKDGKEYPSGTVEEFDKAYCHRKEMGNPTMFFFRKRCSEPIEDPVQYNLVEEFFHTHEDHNDSQRIETILFDDIEQLKERIRRIIFDYIWAHDDLTLLHGHYIHNGVTNLYLPVDNEDRNRLKKQDLLDPSITYVRLIAHSGNSYLQQTANRYFIPLRDFLERGGKADIILTNPFSELGYYLTMGEIRAHRNLTVAERLESISTGNVINKIENADWNKYKQGGALSGYNELKEDYSDRITLRMCKYEMSATILLTDKVAYMEPYLHCYNSEKGMTAFEIRIEKPNENNKMKANCYDSVCQYFDLLWEISEDYDDYLLNIEKHKKQLTKWLKDK